MPSSWSDPDRRIRPTLPPPLIVDTPERLTQLRKALRAVKRMAVDTESNSLFAYRERVCLIQISTDVADYLVDPVRLDGHGDLDFLGDIFAEPRIEKVLHAAEYDVMTLRRDFGFRFANLFDTMLAARVLGWQQVGLGALLEMCFGIRVDKRHQRANWGHRPLSPALIRYAQLDTHYLLPLSDHLRAKLIEGDHLEEANELFNEVAEAEWGGTGFDPRGFWRINGIHALQPQEIAVLEALYLYREQQAKQRNLPVFKVLSENALLELALIQPRTLQELSRVTGITQGVIRQHGIGLLRAIKQGLQSPSPPRPRQQGQPDELVQHRYDALHAWRKERAAQRGVSSEVILSRDTLWKLAEVAPRTLQELATIPSMGTWRIKMYGDELLSVLARANHEWSSSR